MHISRHEIQVYVKKTAFLIGYYFLEYHQTKERTDEFKENIHRPVPPRRLHTLNNPILYLK